MEKEAENTMKESETKTPEMPITTGAEEHFEKNTTKAEPKTPESPITTGAEVALKKENPESGTGDLEKKYMVRRVPAYTREPQKSWREQMKIYISGPITGTSDYMERFARAERKLSSLGYTVINPVRVNAQLPKNTTHEEYMKMSIVMLDMCDAIFMMEGWKESKGCGIEFEYAYEHRITITFEGEKE